MVILSAPAVSHLAASGLRFPPKKWGVFGVERQVRLYNGKHLIATVETLGTKGGYPIELLTDRLDVGVLKALIFHLHVYMSNGLSSPSKTASCSKLNV